MYLGKLTWHDVEQLDWRQVAVIVPLGSLEQHGCHLPLLTDTLIISELASRLERILPQNVLVTPTLWAGVSYVHMGYAGTIFIPPRLMVEWTKAICSSLIGCGARRLVLLNGHGANRSSVQTALIELEWEHQEIDDLRMVHVDYWSLGSEAITEIRDSPIGGIGHAGELETSILMALDESLVRADRIAGVPDFVDELAAPYFSSDMQGTAKVWIVEVFRRLSKAGGVVGSPRFASREKGERFLESLAGALTEFVGDFLAWA